MVKVRALESVKDLKKPFACQIAQKKEFDLSVLDDSRFARFVMENEKETLAIFWFWELGGGRCYVGSFISENAGPFFPEMRTLILRLFDFYDAQRFEALVETAFAEGHRMIKLLGFEREGTMKKFIDGIDYDLYARCK